MTELQRYTGSCHCGHVKIAVHADLSKVYACNCSICSRAGYLLTFPSEEHFELLQGEGAMTDYQFGKKNIHHLFCTTCGVRVYGHGGGKEGKKMFSVNVRCLDGVETEALTVERFDGKSL